MKREVGLSKAKWLVEPGCVVLVTSGTMQKPNVMTFSWQTPVNSSDPLSDTAGDKSSQVQLRFDKAEPTARYKRARPRAARTSPFCWAGVRQK
jgi:hypothetical protein